MSRASMRMKQYRPMSADFSKVSTLSSVFGLNQEPSKPNSSNGVLLINCKFVDIFLKTDLYFFNVESKLP